MSWCMPMSRKKRLGPVLYPAMVPHVRNQGEQMEYELVDLTQTASLLV